VWMKYVLLHDAIYVTQVRVCPLSLVCLMKLDLFFNSCSDGLNILYGGNVVGHPTLKNDFLILNLNDCYNNPSSAFVSYFDPNFESIKRHARLGHLLPS